MNDKDGVSDELKRIYQQAWCEGYWIKELGAGNGFLAAAGSIRQLEEIEKKIGKEIDVSKLDLGDIIAISMPGSGSTREEACLDALKKYKEHEQQKNEPLSLYDSFEEGGYRIEAYIPNSNKVALEFVVRAYSGEKLIEELKVPMLHEPLFGVDVVDHERLEEEVETLMQKLVKRS